MTFVSASLNAGAVPCHQFQDERLRNVEPWSRQCSLSPPLGTKAHQVQLPSRNNDRLHHVGARGHERRRTSRAPAAAAAQRAQRAEPFAGDDEALEAARPHLRRDRRADHPPAATWPGFSLRRRRWHAAARRGVAAARRARALDFTTGAGAFVSTEAMPTVCPSGATVASRWVMCVLGRAARLRAARSKLLETLPRSPGHQILRKANRRRA